MSVKIGSARIDENGKARGGKAGDQTGKEVSTQSWYKHSKGWRVFRAKDPAVAEKIAQDMQWACDNKHIGYDQGQRLTLYDVSKPLGFNCNKVKENCETDCSALVRVCCAYAGVKLPNFRTPTEPAALLDSGAFVELKGAKYTDSDKYLRRGDILVTRTQGHTVVVLSNGSKAGDDDPVPTPAPTPTEYGHVLVTGGSVNIRSAPGVESKDIGTVHRGDVLVYQGETREADGKPWYLVIHDNANGWVRSKYARLVE